MIRCATKEEEDKLKQHVLLQVARLMLTSPVLPAWGFRNFFIEQSDGNVRHSAIILLTSDGKLICQRRLRRSTQEFQCFGGGKWATPLLNKVHSLRRELYMESAIDLNELWDCVQFISKPTICHGPDSDSGCLVQVVVVKAEAVRYKSDIICVCDTQLWSRELNWWAQYREPHDTSQSDMDWGQRLHDGSPAFAMLNPFDEADVNHMRKCDGHTLRAMKQDIHDALLTRDDGGPTVRFTGNHNEKTLSHSQSLLDMVDKTVGWNFAQERWPLIPYNKGSGGPLYQFLHNPSWRENLKREWRDAPLPNGWHFVRGYRYAWVDGQPRQMEPLLQCRPRHYLSDRTAADIRQGEGNDWPGR